MPIEDESTVPFTDRSLCQHSTAGTWSHSWGGEEWWGVRPAANSASMRELFAAVDGTVTKCLQRQLMGYVAQYCLVAWCCHADLVPGGAQALRSHQAS